jgi:hypothetical protein
MDNTRRKINVEESLWRRMRAQAAVEGITVSELVVNAVNAHLEPRVAKKAPEAPAPASKAAPILTNAIADGTGSPQRGVRASAPLEALPDGLRDLPAGVETGRTFRPVPKPRSEPKASGRPLGRRS